MGRHDMKGMQDIWNTDIVGFRQLRKVCIVANQKCLHAMTPRITDIPVAISTGALQG